MQSALPTPIKETLRTGGSPHLTEDPVFIGEKPCHGLCSFIFLNLAADLVFVQSNCVNHYS